MKPHNFHPEADEEYAEAAAYYANISPELGGRFYDEMERVIAEACRAPGLFRRIDADVRRHLADVFPFAIIYLDEPDEIWIVAVMPLRRDPGYWRHRLSD